MSPVTGKCPICSAPTEQQYRPFCSRRCADVDLSRWLRGAYAIPVEPDDEDGESADGAAAGESNPDDDTGHKRRGS
jgi:endogenous inhibitor of DNA gyrase (YacG/DUF329 family)